MYIKYVFSIFNFELNWLDFTKYLQNFRICKTQRNNASAIRDSNFFMDFITQPQLY